MANPAVTPRIQAYDAVFDALYCNDPGKAAAMKLRSEVLMRLRAIVGSLWRYSEDKGATPSNQPAAPESPDARRRPDTLPAR